jgi:hypothetical protein
MNIDISKIKPGDKVTLVPLEVAAIVNGFVCIRKVGGEETYFKDVQIAAHHPAPREFRVRDKVRGYSLTMDVVRSGEIIGLDDDFAWVRWEHLNDRTVHHISQLTLVEGGK